VRVGRASYFTQLTERGNKEHISQTKSPQRCPGAVFVNMVCKADVRWSDLLHDSEDINASTQPQLSWFRV